MNLMAAQSVEFQKELGIDLHAALRTGIELDHPALHALGIKLFVPRSVERIGEIDAAAIATEFDHLRATVERDLRPRGVRRTANDTAEMDGAGEFRVEGIGDIVLLKFAGAPAGDVEEAIVERQVDVGNERRNGFEALEHGGKLVRIGRFGRDFDDLSNFPIAILAMP